MPSREFPLVFYLLVLQSCMSKVPNQYPYRQHFTKTVMRDFKARHGKAESQGTPASTPKKATPQKRRTPAKQAKSKATVDQDDEGTEEDEVLETPTKKIKLDLDTKALLRVKTENAGALGRERRYASPHGCLRVKQSANSVTVLQFRTTRQSFRVGWLRVTRLCFKTTLDGNQSSAF